MKFLIATLLSVLLSAGVVEAAVTTHGGLIEGSERPPQAPAIPQAPEAP